MIAKIGRGANMTGILSYNQLKVEKGVAEILATNRMVEAPDGSSSIMLLQRSFEPYFIANNKTEKPVLHISLNPDPNDKVTDENFREIAQEYMEKMGYSNQPYVVFKHSDIERIHIHIVSVCVDRYGKKIDDSFEKRRSMEVCRGLEEKFGLKPATEKSNSEKMIFHPVNYKGNDIKSQIAAVVRYLPKYYRFQTMGSYNALLSLFNITAKEVSGEIQGEQKKGLVYFALNEQGEKASNPFKASRFGKYAGLDALEKHFMQSKEKMKDSTVKAQLKNTIEVAMNLSTNETDFKKQMIDQGINTVIRRNDQRHIYGMTFIDHESRSIWNGSQLGRNLSANAFNDLWNSNVKQDIKEPVVSQFKISNSYDSDLSLEVPHHLFDFLNMNKHEDSSDLGLFSLLNDAQGEHYEEEQFAKQMKKKKKRYPDQRRR